jgi:threonine dehydrogenase-like Zn-dependent dehydrogenase
MKALCYRGTRKIVCEEMPDATLQAATDVLVKMTACGICGSDLHIYHGEGFSPDLGFCVGHEAIGEVVDVGRDVAG